MRKLIDSQETLDALDERFESLLRRFDYDSYENADEKTKLVCDGLSEAEDVVMGMDTAVPDTNLISRKQAVDALRDYLVEKRCPNDGTLTCRLIENEVINKLPPATDTNVGTKLGTSLAELGTDCISRQAAIDGINELMKIHFDRKIVLGKARRLLEQLPSAQPEPCTDALKAEIKRMKRSFTICINSDYYTGYMSALSAVEGYIAQMEVTT